MNKKLTFCLILTFLLSAITTADTLYVSNPPTPPSWYSTIQAAINDANPGDEVVVANGTYSGIGNRDLDFHGIDITVRSENPDDPCCVAATIIDCNGLGRAFYFHNGETPASVVQGFTIKNGDAYYGGAIECEEAWPTIENCIITNNAAAYGGAIDCFYASPVIINCIITSNTSDYDGGAIECSSESSPIIYNCLILNNTAGGSGAIDCFDGSLPAITNCTIINNTGNANRGGIYATYFSTPTIRSSILWNNGDDIYGATDVNFSCIQDGDAGTGNISSNPMFRRGPYPSDGNYYLSQTAAGQLADSNCINAGGDPNDPNYSADAIFGSGHSFTTRTDNVPDSNTVDMGFHYPDSGIDVNYVLITGVDPNGNYGTIDPNHPAPGQLYKQFTEVSIDANADPNYRVEKWRIDSNDVNDANTTRIITMDANHTVTVKFGPIACKLITYVLSGNGTIEPNYPDGNSFPKNSQMTLNAYPTDANIYGVNRWLKGVTGIFDVNDSNTYTVIYGPNTTYKVTLNTDTTVAVEFGKYLLNTQVDGGHGAINPKHSFQPARKTVPLTAIPDSGYRVKSWTGADNNSPTLTNAVTMTSNKTVTVEFEAIPQYQLTVNINDPNMGSVIPSSGMFFEGTVVNLTATPAAGYIVQGWGGAANNQPAWDVNTNTVTMNADKTVTVTFGDYNRVIHVFGDIMGIQKAIDDANNGDTIKIHPGTYVGTGFTINKIITIVGDPEHPENVIIDCNGQEYGTKRLGFDLSAPSPCTLNGVTIINSHTTSLIPVWQRQPGDNGRNTSNNYSGAIRIAGGHNVKNCIIRDCSINFFPTPDGNDGGDPCDGVTNPNGGRGGNGGNAGGVGIYVASGDPNIMNVLIEDCNVHAGNGGNGGRGWFLLPTDPCAVLLPAGFSGKGGLGGSVTGGAIYLAAGNAKLTDVTIRNCTATSGNGGDGGDGAPDTNDLFPRNGADGNLPGSIKGVGIFCANGTSPVFTNCIVENCTGYGGRGGNGGDGSIEDYSQTFGGYGGLTTVSAAGQGDIRTNTTTGGAVYCGSSSGAKLTNCNFTGNRIYGTTSGIGGWGNLPTYRQEPHKNYRLAGLGAGIFCSTASSVSFNGCHFEDNRTAYNQDFNEPNITNYDGEYTGSGGGLCLWYAFFADINDCDFIQNSAPIGGGIYSIGIQSGMHISDCNITNNVSYAGGGVLMLDSIATINKSIVRGNIAGTQTGYYQDTGYALFGTGGGIYSLNTLIDINDTFITENYARLTGGGICLDGDTPFIQRPLIKNCLVTNNRAVEEGGGIAAIYFAEPKIQNCTIADNIVNDANSNGGGLFASYMADVIVKDTIFWANSGIDGSQIALSSGGPFTDMPSKLVITYSDIDLRIGADFNSIEFESGAGSGSTSASRLVDSQTIYNEINTTGSAKVIVSLDEPTEILETLNWSSPASVSTLRTEIASRQTQVLSTLSTGEFTLRQKLTNSAIFSGQITQAGLTKLLANPAVTHIEPVRTVYPMTAQGIPLMNASSVRQSYNGSGVSIAIVDSGVDYTHLRLGGGGFPNSKVIGGWDFGDNDPDPMDEEGHGTNCAGIAAGSLGTVGDYIGGVAYNAKIYALKTGGPIPGFPSDYGLTSWDWCITHKNDNSANPILVISNSWALVENGLPYLTNNAGEADAKSPAYTTAAQRANQVGITILAASGNDGSAGQGISWPAAMSNVISVGAVYDAVFVSQACGVQTQPDQVTCYSNTADILDILAPSENAYTTAIGGGYDQYFNGTSAACPYAAGAVAALQSAAKQLRNYYLAPAQVRTILRITGNPVTDTKVIITKPRVNLGAAIALLTPSVPVYREVGCTIIGLEQDVNDTWVIDDNNNISDDPNFAISGYYYLSHKDAGQDYNSPCFDIGSDTAVNLGLNIYTTRADGVNDVNIVDLGYHYSEGLPRYQLQIDINTPSTGTGTIEAPWTPGTYYRYANETIRLHAIPDANSRVAMWILDGVQFAIHDRYFSVTMDRPHNVAVKFEFYAPKSIIVPDEYATIQEAIDAAESGDTIYIYRKANGQPYYITDPCGLDFKGKAITIRSEDPADPNVVATTVIDCNQAGRAFIFQNGEDANSIIEGLTITNCLTAGAIATGYQQDPIDGNVYNGGDATGDGYGGAVYIGRNASPTIRYCVFSNCEVTGGRGNDGPDGYDLVQDDPRARGGRGGNGGSGSGNGYGGTIYCGQNSTPTILNCTISNSTARGGIGGDGGNGGNGTTSKIGGNGGNGGNGTGLGYGGAIYASTGANPKIIGCNLFENTASQGLGGAGGSQGAGQIPDDPPYAYPGFDGASIGAGFAGVIYYEKGAKVDINDCNFIGNTAEADTSDIYDTGGGAIYCEPNCAGIKILKANIAGNRTTQGNGGAIWFGANNDVNLTDCYFGGNTANDDGGALVIGQEADANMCTLDFNNCAFTDNIAGIRGGAIMAKNFDATFVDCYINRNTAASGGGLYLISEKSTAKIHGGTIMGNKAIGTNAEGGGAYISNLPIEIINCQITGNSSLYSGGGIMLKGPGTTTSKVHNCLFVSNSAGARGGALLVSLNSWPQITSCTFSENRTEPGGAGGAVFCAYNSSPIIKDCIFDQTKRIAIYESSTDSDPNISYCLFYDNFDGDFYDRDSGITYNSRDVNNPDVNLAALNNATGGHNIEGNPIFLQADLGKYYLSQIPPNPSQSPAINAGNAPAADVNVLPDDNMADYTTRTDSNDPNINAGDAGQLDIGFHYIDVDIEANRPRQFELTTTVIGGHGNIEPLSGRYYAGTTIELTALPQPGWRVNRWAGTDDDSTTNTTNYVVMIRNRSVTVSFEQPRNLYVPGEYTALQYAVNDAKSGDKIIIAKGVYYGQETNLDYGKVYIQGKNITITGTNPDDPCVVAQTIFQGNGFYILNVNSTMVLDGITIQDAHFYPGDVECDEVWAHGPTGDGYNGYSISGGGINLYNASPIIRNCRFVNCSVLASNACNGEGDRGDGGWAGYAWGGAVSIDPTSNPVFKNCQFIDCYVQSSNGGDGAGEWGHGGNWGDPNDSIFHNWDFGPYEEYWYYSGYGGAIYCMSGSKSQFENCLFQGNRAYGGVCGISGTALIGGYPDVHYAIDTFGGAVYMAAGSDANFIDCTFIDNEADTRNQVGPNDANYTDDYVLNDPVIGYGGGICAEGTATIPVLKNCIFINNRACAGGGIYLEDSIAHISRCTFENCISMLGGAMLLTDSNSIIFECDFNGNQAINPAGEGGAIYCASSDAKFYDCEISNNEASTSGGGAYFSGELEPNMHNCLIWHNSAGRDGGGISANWDAQLTLSNCTIAHNTITGNGFTSGFGGGLSCAYEADTKVVNGIIWSNNAEYGPQISIGSNFDAADKRRAEVTVSYSDVEDGAAGVFVDTEHGCILNWDDANNLSGTTLESPLFVTGYWGNYYLSQIITGEPLQTVDSNCVDSGSGLAIDNDMYRHTTRTDHVTVKGQAIDSGIVDMGYHYTLTAEILGDFNFDGIVDINDLGLFELYWMNSGCVFPYFCHERDITEDGEVDFEDFAAFAANYGEIETIPPKPDPMTWAARPRSADANKITMTATTARDNSGSLIKYYFDCVWGSCHDRNWDTNSTYTDTGLTIGLQYGYRVKARDERGNETGWSVIGYTVTGQDDTPPEPDPMTWAAAPYPTSSYSIRMVAASANDISGVEYYFDCVSAGCHDCNNNNWQDSNTYTDVGLEPNTTYTYQVKARDKSTAHNETQFSGPASATTPPIGQEPNEPNEPNVPNDITPPTPNPSQWASVPQSINPGGPYWYHYMTAVTATDASPPVEYSFECTDGSGTSSGWITSPTYTAGPFGGVNHAAYKVRTRDSATPTRNVGLYSQRYHTYFGYLD